MLRITFVFVIALLMVSFCLAQENKILVKSGIEFSIQNKTAIDSDKLNVGDDLKFALSQELKGEGGTIPVASEVYGRVVEVEKASGEGDLSKVTMIFDFIKNGEDFLMLKALVLSVQGNTDVKLESSETYEGGTILSLEGKKLLIESGKELRVKLIEDLGAG